MRYIEKLGLKEESKIKESFVSHEAAVPSYVPFGAFPRLFKEGNVFLHVSNATILKKALVSRLSSENLIYK